MNVFRSEDAYGNISFDFGNDTDVNLEVQSNVDLQAPSHIVDLGLVDFGSAKGT
jgi:hypothetical protein